MLSDRSEAKRVLQICERTDARKEVILSALPGVTTRVCCATLGGSSKIEEQSSAVDDKTRPVTSRVHFLHSDHWPCKA